MFGFDGNVKKRSHINLGGSRNVKDKQTLIQSNQERRLAREHERKRKESVTKIQAFVRSRIIVKKLRASKRLEWDVEAQNYLNSNFSPHVAALNLVSLVRKFLFFYQPLQDVERETRLCYLLTLKRQDTILFIHPFLYDDLRDDWTYQTKRLLVLFLRRFGSHQIHPNFLLDYVNFIRSATDESNYLRIEDEICRKKIVYCLLEHLIQQGLYRELRNHLLGLPVDAEVPSPTIPSLSHLSTLPFRSLSADSPVLIPSIHAFITEILKIPLLMYHVKQELSAFVAAIPIDIVVIELSTMSFKNEEGLKTGTGTELILSTEEAAGLLSNILAFTRPEKIASLSKFAIDRGITLDDVMLAYLEVLKNLFTLIPTSALSKKSQNENTSSSYDDDEDEDEELSSSDPLRPPLDHRLLWWIERFFKGPQLASIFAFAASSSCPTSLLRVCNLLMALMNRWPLKKQQLLTSMMKRIGPDKKDTYVKMIWEGFRAMELYGKINERMFPIAVITDPIYAQQWEMLALLCELFSRVLLTTGDDEFFENGKNPLHLDEVIKMSACLRNVTFALYWNSHFKIESFLEGTCIQLTYLRDILTKVLQQIHARDSRRQFTETGHWLMPMQMDMASFINEAASYDPNAEELPSKIGPRRIAPISHRIKILSSIPFVIPFEDRVKLFRKFVQNDPGRPYNHYRMRVEIRRTHIFEDAYTYLSGLKEELKDRIAISFKDQYNIVEAGIDGGGLLKEFLTLLCKEAFDANRGLFVTTKDQLLYPNTLRYAQEEQQLNCYEFLGRILGKALYEGVLVDFAFAGFFLSKWLNRSSYLDDLPSLDPELYKGLIILKNYDGDVESDFGVNFTVVDNELGESRIVELIPNGANIPVTNETKYQYVFRVANYRLNTQIDKQCKAFFKGLSDLIDPKWLQMFNQQELQVLVGGAQIDINLDDLRQNTVYSGYSDDDVVIQNFWKVVSCFSEEQKRKLIKFVTSCSRPPLLGFGELVPKFAIRNAGKELRLPTSSTCFNLLKLPAYPDENTLRAKLEYAIDAGDATKYKDFRVIVGIDFGTTFSGYAFAHKANPDQIESQDMWPGQEGSLKTNTVLLYDNEWNVIKWGYSALAERPEKKSQRDNCLVELFKLHLGNLSQDKESRLPRGLDYRKAITDYLKKLNESIQETVKARWSKLDYYSHVIKVMTVPAEDDGKARHVMRTCAFEAGIINTLSSEGLEFTSESEAAAIFCVRTLKEHNLNPGCKYTRNIYIYALAESLSLSSIITKRPSATFLVVYFGENTIDLTTRTLLAHNKISEIVAHRNIDFCGSTVIDREFINYIASVVGKSAMYNFEERHYASLQYMIQKFCNNVKFKFDGDSDKFTTKDFDIEEICPALMQYVNGEEKKRMEEAEWIIELDYETVESFFDPAVEYILSVISIHLNQTGATSAILLIGELSESRYLLQKVKNKFSSQVGIIAVPPAPIAAVARGAVYY
ncbi:2866_t:CDS:10, partial [Paraglomus occultum]